MIPRRCRTDPCLSLPVALGTGRFTARPLQGTVELALPRLLAHLVPLLESGQVSARVALLLVLVAQ
jgi:hypothetical protein